MNTLILKLGATGDVVRTTPFLRHLDGEITWITAGKNVALLEGIHDHLKCFSWENRRLAPKVHYDLVINLEDTEEVALFAQSLEARRTFGAYVEAGNALRYTEDARAWFDLSLISRHGRQKADQLKLQNRKSYQELVFAGLGWRFTNDDAYLLPRGTDTGLAGDVAIAAEAGPVWPMKNWAYYSQLQQALEKRGLKVNVLPKRPALLEHLADVRNHCCLVGGDSLPMHFALGHNRRCVSLFNCTSPWEIHDYGLQTKLVSPLLEEFFYQRNFDPRATTAISLEEVLRAVLAQVEASLAAK
jgi:heptosyltransferase II